ncbi:MAG TPA: sigma-70 family RNA polymerase sigma factor [Polyangiaceae bacterium]|jgi:RNA polymerase sigma-70 factor (ECF subfamily)|nr:sigma-70 family RNA polymerase sigma factor [Polyangiaceae bacterium]
MLRLFRTVPEPARGPRVKADPLSALAAAAQAGSADATRTLVVSVMPVILRATRGVLGSRHIEVEDTAQDAALGFVKALTDYRGDCSVIHYATRIAVLTALAARRRLAIRGAGLHQELDEALVAPGESPTEAVLAAHRRRILRALCDELPPPQTEALVLHCVLGLSVEEIAASSSCPTNTVKSRLRLAKEALRQRIEADPELLDGLEVSP